MRRVVVNLYMAISYNRKITDSLLKLYKIYSKKGAM